MRVLVPAVALFTLACTSKTDHGSSSGTTTTDASGTTGAAGCASTRPAANMGDRILGDGRPRRPLQSNTHGLSAGLACVFWTRSGACPQAVSPAAYHP